VRQAWQAVIIAALARSAERMALPIEQGMNMSNMTTAQLAAWRDPAFRELEPAEMAPPYKPGSGAFFRQPLRNLCIIMYKSFDPPFPFGQPASGIRHNTGLPLKVDPNELVENIRIFMGNRRLLRTSSAGSSSGDEGGSTNKRMRFKRSASAASGVGMGSAHGGESGAHVRHGDAASAGAQAQTVETGTASGRQKGGLTEVHVRGNTASV